MNLKAWMPVLLCAGAFAGRPQALAQELHPGELYFKTYIGGIGGHGAAGLLDPASGAFTELFTPAGAAPGTGDFGNGCLAYDPHRRMLLTMKKVAPSNHFGIHAMDGEGHLTELASLGPSAAAWCLSPAGDGRVYFLHSKSFGALEPIRWLDAQNALHTLLDAATGQPYVPPHPLLLLNEAMTYEPQTNALFFATPGNVSTGCAGGPTQLTVHRAPLSADGTKVVGPIGCIQIDVFGGISNPTGWSVLPGGDLLLATSGAVVSIDQPRLFEVDPFTLAFSTFASPGVSTTCAGMWSEMQQKALVVDYSVEKLRSYAAGAGGLGSPAVDLSIDVGQASAALVEIPLDAACPGDAVTYGAGLAGAGGFVPWISAFGCPDLGQPFTVAAGDAKGGASGVLAVGFNQAALPLFGGTLFLFPISSTLPFTAGGTTGAAGAGVFALPLLFADPAFAGLTFYLQAAFLDAAAVQGVALTNGLRITLG